MRADLYLYSKGYCRSRTEAKRLIENGWVLLDGVPIKKPGYNIESGENEEDRIKIVERSRFVSRGGEKLDFALSYFSVDVKDKIALDAGASTGGFTDCLLQNGAAFVYSVDCGHDQLSPVLKNNPKVKSCEGVNIRYLTRDDIPAACDICVCDLSFISQTLCYDSILSVISDNAIFITLYKPQFEVGRKYIGKNGIVHDRDAVFSTATDIIEYGISRCLECRGFISSPILGGDGNLEYLIYYQRNNSVKDTGISEKIYNQIKSEIYRI